MNRFIAKIYALILEILHFAVLGVLVYVFFKYREFKETYLFKSIEMYFANNGYSGSFDLIVYVCIILIFIIYVIIIGFLSTFIAINENLEEIRENLKRNQS